jgi:hypothetical protein
MDTHWNYLGHDIQHTEELIREIERKAEDHQDFDKFSRYYEEKGYRYFLNYYLGRIDEVEKLCFPAGFDTAMSKYKYPKNFSMLLSIYWHLKSSLQMQKAVKECMEHYTCFPFLNIGLAGKAFHQYYDFEEICTFFPVHVQY